MRGAFEETQTGWVYRSDAAPRRQDAPGIDSAWTGPAAVGGERFPREDEEPSAAGGWIEAGLFMMALPFAFTAGLMLAPMVAPMVWIFGRRSDEKDY